jgi:hypothetical protein
MALTLALPALAGCARDPVPQPLETAAGSGAMLPRLNSDAAGRVWLSWVEPASGGHALRFSALEDERWGPARTAARGENWFVNWADFPSLVHLGDERFAAHWLRKLEGGPYAYEVLMAVSSDGGEHWSSPVTPHGDGTATEHGFASLFPVAGGVGAVWLDGRNTGGGGDGGGHDHGGGGAMTLRAGGLDWAGQPLPDAQLDAMTCDCCPTSAAASMQGTVVVYRGRSKNEIRDIFATTLGPEGWSAPVAVATDDWEMPACPVNGPAIAARGKRVAAAWFTAPGGRPSVRVGFSLDGGRSWSEPAEVAAGATLGRVAIVMPDEDSAVVSWLESAEGGAVIRYRRMHADGRSGRAMALASTSAARSSGFPQLALQGERLVFAWTEVGEPSAIATATVPMPRQ